MRNAHNAALLAMFAEAEQREKDDKSARVVLLWDQVKRPIALDLAALNQNFRKARA